MSVPKKTRKKRNSSSKKTDESLSDSLSSEPILTKFEKANIEHLISHALNRYKDDQILDKKHKTQELSHLALMCEEYLSTFALLGYSLEGEKIIVFNMPTAKDEAALVDLLRSTFIDIASNRP